MIAGLPKIVHILGGCIMIVPTCEKELDNEWVELIKQALALEISVDEIRDFLNK
ncbi:hypothetical protein QF028_005908 [Neobacillus sp. B4I6]|jgi:hypothetical protein